MTKTFAFALLLLGSSAHANLVDVMATGFLNYQQATNPYFASAFPEDLTLYGKAVSIQMQFDTAAPGLLSDLAVGRAYYGSLTADWVQMTSLTIGGQSFASLLPQSDGLQPQDGVDVWDHGLDARNLDELWICDGARWIDAAVEGDRILTRASVVAIGVDARSSLVDFVDGLSLEQGFALDTPPDLFGLAGISFAQTYSCVTAGGESCSASGSDVRVNEGVALTGVTIRAVPEPGALALLVAGLPLLRRRDRP